MDWIILGWIGAALAICIAPIFYREDHRRLWLERWRTRRWNVSTTTPVLSSTAEHHSKLTKEERIRLCACHVQDKLKPFTRTLQPSDIDVRSTRSTSDSDDDDIEQPSNHCSSRAMHHYNEQPRTNETTSALTDTSTASDSSSDDSDSDEDDHHGSLHSYEWDSSPDDNDVGHVCVPCAGYRSDSPPSNDSPTAAPKSRWVCSPCSICLSSLDVDQPVAWAGNPACPHVFHEACIAQWLTAAGSKHLYQKVQAQNHPLEEGDADFQRRLLEQIPMLCPNCRQDFVPSDNGVIDDAPCRPEHDDQPSTEPIVGDVDHFSSNAV